MEIKRLGLVCAVLLLSQLLVVGCEEQKEEKERKEGKKDRAGKEKPTDGGKQRAAKKEEKNPAAGSEQNEKGQKPKGGKGSPKGKFSTKEKAECSWTVSEADSVSLQVECTQGSSSFSCVFAGQPSACPQYAANPKSYWKQITRALKKQKDMCQDPKAALKAKDCKRGPHLTLLSSTLLPTAPAAVKEDKKSHRSKKIPKNAEPTAANPGPSEGSKDCVEDVDSVDQKKLAEEYCGDTWSSFCTFFISILQDKKC